MSTAQTRSAPNSCARAQAIRPMAPTPKTRTFLPAAPGYIFDEEPLGTEGGEIYESPNDGCDDGGHIPALRDA